MKDGKRNAARPSPRARWFAASAAIILLVAALVRIVYIVQLQRADIGAVLPLDMRFFRDLAAGLAAGAGPPGGVFTFNPLYPAVLALIFRLFGEGLLAPRVIQALLGLATIALLFAAGRMLAGRGGPRDPDGRLVGVLAAAIAVLYPQLLVYEGSLLATTLVTFFLTTAFVLGLAVARALDGAAGGGLRLAALAALLGLVIGAGALGRPNLFLVLAPLVPAWLFLRAGARRARLRLALACALGIAAALAPPTIYNAARSGRFVPVSAHGGINFYIGNGPAATGIYRPPPGMREDMRGLIEDAAAAASAAAGRELGAAEVSAYWSRLARERIALDPWGWLRLLARKFALYWNGIEFGDIVDGGMYAEQCPVLRLLPVRFALISPLAMAGALMLAARSRERALYLVFLAASLAAVVLFYFNSRYRMPSVPLLILSAAWLIAWLVRAAGRRDWKRVAAGIMAAILCHGFVSGREMIVVNRSAGHTFMGNHYMSAGEREKALAAFGEALRIEPESPLTRINYARALRLAGDREGAREHYAAAWRLDRDFPKLALEYGSLLEELGERREAQRLYYAAWESTRRYDRILACKLLSRAAYAEGRIDEAGMWIERALEIAPGDEELMQLRERLAIP